MTGVSMYDLNGIQWNAMLNSYVEYDLQGKMIRKVSSQTTPAPTSIKQAANKVVAEKALSTTAPATQPTNTNYIAPSSSVQVSQGPMGGGTQHNYLLYFIIGAAAIFLLTSN